MPRPRKTKSPEEQLAELMRSQEEAQREIQRLRQELQRASAPPTAPAPAQPRMPRDMRQYPDFIEDDDPPGGGPAPPVSGEVYRAHMLERSDHSIVHNNVKYFMTTVKVSNIPWRHERILAEVDRAFRNHVVFNGDRWYISLDGYARTAAIDRQTDQTKSEIESTLQRFKGVLIDNASQLSALVFSFMERIEDLLNRRLVESDAHGVVKSLSTLLIQMKRIVNDAGGAYIIMPQSYESFLFNPESEHHCFWMCLEEAGVKFSKNKGLIMDELGMNYNCMVKQLRINKIIQYAENRVNLCLFKPGNDGKYTKTSYDNKSASCTDEEALHVNLALIMNHYMLITDVTEFKRSCKTDEFVAPTPSAPIDESLSSQFTTSILEPKDTRAPSFHKNSYFWDMETHTTVDGQHTPYNIGYSSYDDALHDLVVVHYGYDCVDQFVAYLSGLAEDLKTELDRKTRGLDENCAAYRSRKRQVSVTFWSHNGGRYDHFLILKRVLKVEFVLISAGIILISCFDGLIQFKDFFRHCGQSLSRLCDAFGLPKEYCKTSFPHDFVNSTKDIHYSGDVPPAQYWPKDHGDRTIPDYISSPFDLQAVSIAYQKLDVIALAHCYKCYCEAMIKITGLDPSQKLTGPGFANEYVINSISNFDHTNDGIHKIHLIKDIKLDGFIRKAIRGGRCFVQKSYFQSDHYSELSNWSNMSQADRVKLYESVVDALVDFDATSMYASAMTLYKYPVGTPRVLLSDEFDSVMTLLNTQRYDKTCIIRCDVDFDRPERFCTALISESVDGHLEYNFLKKERIEICSVDLEEAIKYNGAHVTKVYDVLQWDSTAFIFRHCIKQLFELRLKNKNNAVGDCCKTLMNSSYGRLIMKILDTQTKVYSDNESFDADLLRGAVDGFTALNEEQVLASVRKDLNDNSVTDPSHLGVFILAYSKRIMNQCVDKFNGFQDWENTFYYTDTDSMIIKKSLLDQLKNEVVSFPKHKNDTNVIPVVGKGMGQLHDDLDLIDAKIVRGIWIRPKLYLLEYIGKNKKTGEMEKDFHVRSKGVSKSYLDDLDEERLKEDYMKMLLGESVTYKEIQRFERNWKTRNGEIGIKTVSESKTINRTPWEGREYDPNTFRWLPKL